MKTLLCALLSLPLRLSADSIMFTASATDMQQASGYDGLPFSGKLNIPQFNPAVGELTGISFGLTINASLNWQLIQEREVSFTTLETIASLNFLGITGLSLRQMDTGPHSPCGVDTAPDPCAPVHTNFWYGDPISATGFIEKDSSRFASSLMGFDDHPGLLDSFIGTGFELPITTDLRGIPTDLRGGLDGEQSIRWDVELIYIYTPAAAPSVTPEPRWGGLFLLALMYGFRGAIH